MVLTGISLAVNHSDLDHGKTRNLPKVVEVGSSAHSPFEFTGMDDIGFETLLGKIFRIEGNYEIRFAGFGAEAKRVVLGIGRNFSRGLHLHLFSPLSDQVDDFPDEIRTNAEALQNFLVFFQNIFRYEPDEIVSLAPPVEYIGTRIPARNKRLSEARYTSHKHARVNNSPWLAFLSFLRQR